MKHACGLFVFTCLTGTLFAQQPVIYYPFEEGAGTDIVNQLQVPVTNAVLNGVDGDERWVAGAPDGSSPGGGLDFDGDNSGAGDWIDSGRTTVSLGMTDQDYTASAWIKPDTLGGDKMVFGTHGGTYLHNGIRGDALHFGHHGADLPGVGGVRPNRWIHVTFVYNAGAELIYLDGMIDNGPALRNVIRNTSNLLIGQAINTTSSSFDGVIDEVAIWDVALAQNQIEALAAGASPTNLPAATVEVPDRPLISFQGANGLWNVYQPMGIGAGYGAPVNWGTAYTNAANAILTLDANSYTGHLAWVENLAENAFVHLIASKGNVWIGASDNERFGGMESGTDPVNGWVWAGNGADTPPAYTYHNFIRPGEPNNAGGGEDAAHLRADGFWNDQVADIPSDRFGGPSYKYVIEWETQLSQPAPGTRVLQPVIPASLPGDPGAANKLSAYELHDSGPALTIAQVAANLLATNGIPTTGYISDANVFDPESNGGGGRFQGGSAYLGDTPSDDNYISSAYKGTIVIPSAGEWTFGNRVDNVTALRIVGGEFIWANGNLCIDPSDPSTVFTRTGADGRAGIVLDAGEYDIEIISGENTGGAHWEWFASDGRRLSEGDSSTWRPIGFQSHGDLGVPGMVITNLNTWIVNTSDAGGPQLLSIADAEAELALVNNLTDEISLNFDDPNDSGGGGSLGGDRAFPNDTPADDEDFAVKANGFLEIPVDGIYQFGFQGDDGGYLQIHGQTWDQILLTATGSATINGDRIQCDCLTGNSRTIGRMTLTAGIYEVTALFFERSGGAYWEVFGSDITQNPVLLVGGAATTIPDFPGLELTGPTITPDIVIDSIFYDGMIPSVTLTWQSEPGAMYTIQAADEAYAFIPVMSGIASQGATTTETVDGPFGTPFTVFRIALDPDAP